MAYIKKRLENLKPGKEYLLTVRSKNADLNVSSDYAGSIRFRVPQDSTIPGTITNLSLYASFEKVMFVFDFATDLDIDKYEYELYDGNDIGTATLVSSGFNAANVFTVAVANSYTSETSPGSGVFSETARSYWGRVRAIDTTGNAGEWTSLVETDTETPLIDEQFIDTLTASKITAGIIGAHTIQLNGVNSIIQSSNYAAGTAGWKIEGDGSAEFGDATIRGTIDIGGNDNTSFHVDVNGNMWMGSGTLGAAPFRVSSGGVVEIGNATASSGSNTSLFINTDGSINIGTALGTGPFQVTNTGSILVGTNPERFRINANGTVEIGRATDSGNTLTSLFIDHDGAINIGTSLGTGNFQVQADGQIDIGSGANSFHIANDGTVWSGSTTLNTSTTPFVLNPDGSIDIGGSDATSVHIYDTGDISAGSVKGKRQTSSRSISTITGLTTATLTITTATDHDLIAGQKITITGTTTSYANQLNVIDKEVTEVTSSTVFKIPNPIYQTVTNVQASTPSVGTVRYTTSEVHNFRVGQTVVISGITPAGYSGTFTIAAINGTKSFDITNATTGTATLTAPVARVTLTYTAGTGSVVRYAPFYVVASSGLARVSSIEASGEIFGSSNHLNLTSVLRINDTIAIGANTIRGSSSYSSYDEGINFSLSAAGGFVGRIDTTNVVQIGALGITMGTAAIPLPITAYDYMRVVNNGSAASPSYRFSSASDGFYTNGTDPYWSNGGTGYVIYSTRNLTGTVWTSNNDGSGSGLDADKLDGNDSSDFVQTSGTQTVGGGKTFTGLVSFDGSLEKGSNVPYTGGYARWSGSTGGYIGYNSSSSINYKTNIEQIEASLLDPYKLLHVPVKQFMYKDGYLGEGDKKIGCLLPGFMAEDIHEHYPAAGTVDENDLPESWDPFFIIPPMLKLIQDLFKKVDILESRINNGY